VAIDTDLEQQMAAPRKGGRPGWRTARVNLGLLSLPVFWLLLFFLVPVILVAMYSVGLLTFFPTYDKYLSLEAWRRFLGSSTYLGTPWSRGLFWKSMKMSLGVSITCVLLSYPVAYMLALVAGRRKYTLLLVIIVPFLTSYLLRVLAWRVILNPQGVIQTGLRAAGLLNTEQTIPWMFNSIFAVYLVLAYVWVPFVALPIFVSLESLDLHMLEASSDLGASRWTTFRRVTLPMSLPGVIAAFVFVFIPTIGEYVTPQLVGGKSGQMFGNVIQSDFAQSFDWQLGSAMSMFLIFAVAIMLAIFGRYLNVRTVAE
jgi:spermidine/putrescine transport system permease protein